MHLSDANSNTLNYMPVKGQVIDMQGFRPLMHRQGGLMNENDIQQSSEKELTSTIDLEGQVSVANFINGLKRNAAEEYTKLLLYFLQNEELTMRQAESITGELRQTNHGRFNRLREAKILSREKKRSIEGKLEYHYFLSPKVSKDEIASEAKKRSISISNAALQVENFSIEEPIKTMTDSSSTPTASTQFVQEHRPSATDRLLDKLPEFDSAWPEEVKASWLKSYQELISMVKK